jgi:hypothetical protein
MRSCLMECVELRSAAPRSGAEAGRAERDPVGQGDGRHQAPALVTDPPGDLDPLGLKGGHGGGDVVAEQVQFRPAALVGGVDGDLGLRAKISQPPPASTVRVPRTLARVARVASASSL